MYSYVPIKMNSLLAICFEVNDLELVADAISGSSASSLPQQVLVEGVVDLSS